MIFYIIKLAFKFIKALSDGLNFIHNLALLKFFKVSYKTNCKIKGRVYLRNFGSIDIGRNVTVNSCYSSNPIGGQSFSSIVVTKTGKLTISDSVGISNTAIYCTKSILIGNRVFIGGNCKIYDTDFHSLDPVKRKDKKDKGVSKDVVIGNDVFIGAGCTILKGVKIGCNSVIGAGSLVSKSIPENQIWAGNPIVFIRNNYN